jgi:hypothetical protein
MATRTSCRAALAALLIGSGSTASAQVFDGGLPAGWECRGSCGTATADGAIELAPSGGSRYGWVSNAAGEVGVLLPGVGVPANSTDGSTLRSHAFDAGAGQVLAFSFNYVSTDGSDFTDYAWARLLHADGSPAAVLVTARTSPGGDAVPGFDMPAAQASIMPPFAGIGGGPLAWSPLGDDSGNCYAQPCGQTGWIDATYTIGTAGQYRLEFGVVNWADRSADSGLAFDAIRLDGVPLAPIPEPAGSGMLVAGMLVLAFAHRLRKGR